MSKKIKRTLIIAFVIIAAAVLGFYIYTLDYYRANEEAQKVVSQEENSKFYKENNLYVFSPEEKNSTGIIFYPGGKVEASAYAPLMKELSDKGYMVVLVEMPFNLAVFDIKAAEEVMEEFPEIDNWYIAGHSLGGAMASSYAAEGPDKLQGVILLGAYPSSDLSDKDLSLLVLYGSEDEVLNRDAIEENKSNNPKDSEYIEIPGGNHAYFGSYGEQEGDGTASLTPEKQRAITAEEIDRFISER
ncbi:alpha/beta fold hydrolase [Alloiococcus sp. CFN-8]|uniref:alpha/beta fold hydrolase n=1 Tax=Alloiococcus sp. CFN-8 TaxID=3416081 RepID=UPI003CF7C8FF